MNFTTAQSVEQVAWAMRLSNYPRELNRARVDGLAGGEPPYSADEAVRGMIEVNVSDLSLTRLAHDARAQLYQAFIKPGHFFRANTDAGAVARRRERSVIVTNEATRILKRSNHYLENLRSKIASCVLHGIGPSNWEHADRCCPIPLGVDDIWLPTNTVLSMRNLPFFAIYRPYTAQELKRLTRHRAIAGKAGWNLEEVDAAVKWVDDQTAKMFGGTSWVEYWSPQKQKERARQDAGIYASDLVQTIDCIDFYYWDDAHRHEGWRRRIIFDAMGGYVAWRGPNSYGEKAYDRRTKRVDYSRMPSQNLLREEKSRFLFTSGDRVFADSLEQIVHFQFADLAARAPFTYHGVRGLGWLVYSTCHLLNRLRCSHMEAVFENLMMLLRVQSEDELEKALRIKLANRSIIDATVQFVPAAERWQPNHQLAQSGIGELRQIISELSSSWVQSQAFGSDSVEKKQIEVLAKVASMQGMVSSALQQAYRYQQSEYREIFRRLLKRHSTDPDANEFQARCLRHGVPEKYLVADCWDIEPERVIGAGNRMMELAIANQLWEMRAAFAPEAQQQIAHDVVLAWTEDADKADALVPRQPGISDDRHDAMAAFGTLMVGGRVELTKSQNRLDVASVWIGELGLQIQAAKAMGNMVGQDKILGLRNVLTHIGKLLQELGEDPAQKQAVQQMTQVVGKFQNEVKGFQQRLMQQMKARAQQGDGKGAETAAKVQEIQVLARAKADTMQKSRAERAAQRQLEWEAEQRRQDQEHGMEMRRKMQDQRTENMATDLRTASEIRRNRLAVLQEGTKQ